MPADGETIRVAVVGAGSWGTAVASMLAPRVDTTLWARNPDLAAAIDAGDNPAYLPDRKSVASGKR